MTNATGQQASDCYHCTQRGCIRSSHADLCGRSIYSGTRLSRRGLCHGVNITHIIVWYVRISASQTYFVVSTIDATNEGTWQARAEKLSARTRLVISGHISIYCIIIRLFHSLSGRCQNHLQYNIQPESVETACATLTISERGVKSAMSSIVSSVRNLAFNIFLSLEFFMSV